MLEYASGCTVDSVRCEQSADGIPSPTGVMAEGLMSHAGGEVKDTLSDGVKSFFSRPLPQSIQPLVSRN